MNQETLINIIRASKLQPLNFVAITQIAGSQTETLTTGLPTISLGPAQTAAQHVYQISNSLASAVNGSYQSAPLVSTPFQTGMLSPVDQTTVAMLVTAHPREPVLYSVIDSITITSAEQGKEVFRFRNDPLKDVAPRSLGRDVESCDPLKDVERCDCPKRLDHDREKIKNDLEQIRILEKKNKPEDAKELKKLKIDLRTTIDTCNYSLFLNYMGVLADGGLTSELLPSKTAGNRNSALAPGAPKQAPAPAAPAAQRSSDKAAGSSATTMVGHMCFDPTRRTTNEEVKPVCGTLNSVDDTASSPAPLTYFLPPFGKVQLTLSIRSPLGVYQYFGKLLRSKQKPWAAYQAIEARNLVAESEPFLNVTSDSSAKCFVSTNYADEFYCVPADSLHTPMLINILQELRNLNISPSDLNSSFTVRLQGN